MTDGESGEIRVLVNRNSKTVHESKFCGIKDFKKLDKPFVEMVPLSEIDMDEYEECGICVDRSDRWENLVDYNEQR